MKAALHLLTVALLLVVTFAPPRRARSQAPAAAGPGPFASGWREVTVPRAVGGSFAAVTYYPAAGAGGPAAPLEQTGAPFPAITFGHGFQQPVDTYSSTLRHLASWGFIVIAPRSYENSLLPSHSQFADDLRDSLTYLSAENGVAGSPFYQAVAPRFGASGHSMGGGASLLAADRDQRIIAVSNMAAAETIPSAIAAMAGITRPVQLIAGSDDTIVPPARHQVPQYDNGHAPKQAPLIVGGFHCGFQDQSAFALFCDTGAISRTLQLSITRDLLTNWFMLYLRDDPPRWVDVWGPPAWSQPLVQLTADSGIELAPRSVTSTLGAGQVASYTITLTNTGPVTNSYAIQAQSLLLVTPSVTTTVLISPRGALDLDVAVQGGAVERATVTVTVRSLYDGGTTNWINVTALLTSTAGYTVSLPAIPRSNAP